ncbi:MAG TPA: VOC family protein [Actinocrinis sp.]|nr:VOC family protein [Actinocrinis sp.]
MLSQIRILVDDFPASYLFYRDVLGLTPQEHGGDPAQAQAGPYGNFKDASGGTDLALFDRALMAKAIGADQAERGSSDHAVLAFRVPDVDAAYADAIGRGAQSAAAPVDQPAWGMRVAHVRAPEGTLIEFCAWDD